MRNLFCSIIVIFVAGSVWAGTPDGDAALVRAGLSRHRMDLGYQYQTTTVHGEEIDTVQVGSIYQSEHEGFLFSSTSSDFFVIGQDGYAVVNHKARTARLHRFASPAEASQFRASYSDGHLSAVIIDSLLLKGAIDPIAGTDAGTVQFRLIPPPNRLMDTVELTLRREDSMPIQLRVVTLRPLSPYLPFTTGNTVLQSTLLTKYQTVPEGEALEAYSHRASLLSHCRQRYAAYTLTEL